LISIFAFLCIPADLVHTGVTHPFPTPTPPIIPPVSKAVYHTISSMSFPHYFLISLCKNFFSSVWPSKSAFVCRCTKY